MIHAEAHDVGHVLLSIEVQVRIFAILKCRTVIVIPLYYPFNLSCVVEAAAGESSPQ